MFPPHIRLFSDNEDEPEAQRQPSDSSNTLMNFDPVSRDNHDDILRSVQLLLRNYGKCCLWGNSRVTMCGNSPRTNRIRSLDIFIDDTMSICRKHRCSYGINWYDSKPTCHHSDHNPKHRPSPRDYRRANITICSEIEGFPVEGSVSEFAINDARDSMNRILSQVNLSSIRSQTRKRLDKHSDSGLRRITSKLTSTMKVIQKKVAETLAPGQSEQLLRISQLETGIENTRIFNETMDNEMVQNLKQIYDAYVEQKMPFIEQIRLLSLLRRSWKYEKIMEIFGSSKHAVKAAHKMHDAQQYIFKQNTEQSIRQRMDPEKIKHFVNWLVESSALVIGLVRTKLYDIINSIKPAQQQIVSSFDEFVAEGVEAWRSLSSHLGKTNVRNVASVRSVRYSQEAMKIYKASNIGSGISIKRADREYYDLLFCPVTGCTATFESNIELSAHISANQHVIVDDVPRTTNDIARIHLTEILRSTSTRSRSEAEAILQHQNATIHDVSGSFHHRFFSVCGWALRTRKLGKPMSDKVKNFIEQI
ncbi:unnamed protein product [Rotaria magnacalcarata]|uniref:C2H2-type domain-containing protein n=1 Tax=Rotaria magnacalcarata TaxID=392030 RepID=A0A8S2PTS0_9BILA|nr:unnamed protein product [Rotaria magnacalcarata]